MSTRSGDPCMVETRLLPLNMMLVTSVETHLQPEAVDMTPSFSSLTGTTL